VPPTGAKGLNLALHDVKVLAEAVIDWYRTGNASALDAYSDTCLRRIWRAEHFSWWMTHMLHPPEGQETFDFKLQLSLLRYVTSSLAAAGSLAENYVGLETV
jgi:p-hydroxybenzoate 3-monooxygenase